MDTLSLFGDPTPGFDKDLFLCYETVGRSETLSASEFHDSLRRSLRSLPPPVVAPLLLIRKASLGLHPTFVRQRLRAVRQQASLIDTAHRTRARRLPLTSDQKSLLEREAAVRDELQELQAAAQQETLEALDVASDLQQLVDRQGHGQRLAVPAGADLAEVLCHTNLENMLCRRLQYLVVHFEVPGSDSEHRTLSDEVTRDGGPRNFYTAYKGQAWVPCWRGFPGEAEGSSSNSNSGGGSPLSLRTVEPLEVAPQPVLPPLVVERATYGHRTDAKKKRDVTAEVSTLVLRQGGSFLHISRRDGLTQLLRTNPIRYYRKELQVSCTTRGLTGSLRVPVDPSGAVQAQVRLGYPDEPGPKELAM